MYDFTLNTVGADPEFFLENDKGVFPAVGIITGSKEKPQPIGGGFFIQRDCLLAEGNIPPAKTKEEFVGHMKYLKNYINILVGKRGLRLAYYDSARFTPRFLRIPEAYEFGCAPVSYAWSKLKIKSTSITDLANSDMRPAGFHIHIGYKATKVNKYITSEYAYDYDFNIIITRLFDLFITNPLRHIHNDPFRSKFYGQFGSYRPKPYGVECRSLGSFFTQDEYLEYIWDQIQKIFKYLKKYERKLILLTNQGRASHISLTDSSLIDKSTYDLYEINLEEQIPKKLLVYA